MAATPEEAALDTPHSVDVRRAEGEVESYV